MAATEIRHEGNDLKVNRGLIKRLLIDRLSLEIPTVESPFQYLLSSYCCAIEELKKIANMKDKKVKSMLELSIKQTKKLFISYCKIHLGTSELFLSNLDSNKNSNDSPLLPLIFVAVDGFICRGTQPPPQEFLEEPLKDGDFDILDPILKWLY